MHKYCVDVDFNVPLLRDTTILENYKISHHSVLMSKEQKINFLHPELLKIFDEFKLKIWLITIFYKIPDASNAIGGYNIHVDGDPFLDSDKQLRDVVKINWIFNPGNSVMNWYKPKENVIKNMSTSVVNTHYIKYNIEDVELQYTQALTSTHIVQIGVPHDVLHVDVPRHCVSIALAHADNRRLTMDEAVDIFKKYII